MANHDDWALEIWEALDDNRAEGGNGLTKLEMLQQTGLRMWQIDAGMRRLNHFFVAEKEQPLAYIDGRWIIPELEEEFVRWDTTLIRHQVTRAHTSVVRATAALAKWPSAHRRFALKQMRRLADSMQDLLEYVEEREEELAQQGQ